MSYDLLHGGTHRFSRTGRISSPQQVQMFKFCLNTSIVEKIFVVVVAVVVVAVVIVVVAVSIFCIDEISIFLHRTI